MEADRTELNDLAAEMPGRVKAMADAWESCALRVKAKPWPWGRDKKTPKKANNKKRFDLKPGANLPKQDAPQTAGKSLTIEAHLTTPGNGVIIAQGGLAHGYTLYVQNGKPAFSTRTRGKLTTLTASEALPKGPCTIAVHLPITGDVVLTVNGKDVARVKSPGAIATPADGLTVGRDGGDPVGPYEGPREFGGEIEGVTVRLGE